MNDVYKEQMVKQAPTTKDRLIQAGAFVLSIGILFLAMTFAPEFFIFALAAVGFGVYYLFGFLSREYEYILTNGDLDVDCIHGKSRRRRIFSGDLKNFEMMAHVNDMGYESVFKKAVVRKDCSDGQPSNNTYKFAAPYKGKLMSVVFTPNDEMLRLMAPYLGQRRLSMKK